MHRGDGQLRRRLATGLAAASATAFVLTIAVVATSPAPPPEDADAARPPTTVTSRPPDTSARPSAAPNDQPAGSDTSEDLAPVDPAQGDAEPAPTPTPTEEPVAEPPSEEPDTSSRVSPPDDHGARLWGRWYRAEHLREGDDRVVVAGDHPLYVGFLRQDDGDDLIWMTSCNTFGGELVVEPERLRLRGIGGTADDCEEDIQEDQEEWLAAFFGAEPHWRALGERLRLWTPDGRRIDLVEQADGPGQPGS